MKTDYNLTDTDWEIIRKLLSIEHMQMAFQLGFVNQEPKIISDEQVLRIIGIVDELSRNCDETSHRITTLLCALLWKYKKPEWSGLRDFFIIVLSRIGLAPTAIMVDEDYIEDSGRHASLSSFISQLTVSLNQFKNEVYVSEERYSLTSFQKKVWDNIDKKKVIGISAPTSAGKSFVILLKCIEALIQKGGSIVYIVPNLSLVSQVSSDFRKLINKFKLNDVHILNTFYDNTLENKIYVLTQERAIGAFAHTESPFNKLRFLVVDEIQNIEHVSNESDERSKVLYDTLIDFRYNSSPEKIIISGPRINNIEELAESIFGQEAIEAETEHSPVVNITYSISKKHNNFFFKQYADILDSPNTIHIKNSNMIKGIGGKRYNDQFHEYLSETIDGLGKESINIVFSPTSNQARKTALALSDKNTENHSEPYLNSLITYIEKTVHPKYDLIKTLKNHVAYHHGKLPHHIRKVLEKAISDKLVGNIVCTTTLMQGVNLPAQNIIIRNPNLFINQRQNSSKLSNYEFANLRGRAGRLLKDFIGRTFVLDESSFEIESNEGAQHSLFEDTTLSLNTGYGDRFEQNRYELMDCLEHNESPQEEVNFAYLLPYIRQMILFHGDKARERFETVGIHIDKRSIQKIENNLKNLEVPLSVCKANRYWDPIELDKMYKHKRKPNLPVTSSDKDIVDKLYYAILFMKRNFPFYFKKNLSIENDSLLKSLCINADMWLKEIPLKNILNTDYHNDPENIDKTINSLQNTVSYKLPSLLKPMYDIKFPESNFLSFIELGAYRTTTRKLIEMGVPRETAIDLSSEYMFDITDNENIEKLLTKRLKQISPSLSYWVNIQLNALY
jgi:DEAD/DEAH box helicase